MTSGSTIVDLASTSTGAAKKFAETSGGTPVTSVTIPDGSSTENFYYYDELAGSYTISVSARGLTGDSKPLTVNPKGCIIATAAYGSEMSPEVAYMRIVRDNMIGSTNIVRILVGCWNIFYYSWSPIVAQLKDKSDTLKFTFKALLLPLLGIAHITAQEYTSLMWLNHELASITAFVTAAVLSISVYLISPFLIVKIKIKLIRKTMKRLGGL